MGGRVSFEEDEGSGNDESWLGKESCWGENLLHEEDEDDADEVGMCPRVEGRSHLSHLGDTGVKRVSGIPLPLSCPNLRVQPAEEKIPATKSVLLKRKKVAKIKKVKCRGGWKKGHVLPSVGPCLEAQQAIENSVEEVLLLKLGDNVEPLCYSAQSSATGSFPQIITVDSIPPFLNQNSPDRQGRPKRKGIIKKRFPNPLFKMAPISDRRKPKKIKKMSSKVKLHQMDVLPEEASAHVDSSISNSISDSHVRKVRTK
ncbi:hypothetical protein TanjilG_05069 [Lupinus angustifolius]|uniref:Uncharacterized protein n=1 Tax=Lupinus angustifolius TaxID=3871 RepID=A0A4P1R539_LUPAN|nr:hypothetical protein TanjilG_05069 [Lupinus angustifolius]